MRNVYLDNNATTQVAPEVTEAMLPLFSEHWGNPSSMHAFGGRVKRFIDRAREQTAALIGAHPQEIVFTGCGTESDNMAIFGTAEAVGPSMPIVTSRVEHLAVLEPCRRLARHGHRIEEIGVDRGGLLDMDAFAAAVKRTPTLVSLMWANNETGVLFPIEEAAALAANAGGIVHTDAVQAAGKTPIDVSRVPVHLLSISGHKLHAPKGIGALFIRKGAKLKPFLLGGHQEEGRRAGTENVPYIVGFGLACELAARALDRMRTDVAALRDRLEAALLASCPDASVNGDPARRVPNTTNMSFQFIEGESILYLLSDEGIAASSGSACTSGSLEPSHVIRAMGIPFTAAHGSIRFSLSRYTTQDDIDHVISALPPIVQRLRRLSPFV